jgi:hypothetical protein
MTKMRRFFTGLPVVILLLMLPCCRSKRYPRVTRAVDKTAVLPLNIPLPFYDDQLPIRSHQISENKKDEQSIIRLLVTVPVVDIIFFYTESMYRLGWSCLQRIVTDRYTILQFQSVRHICSVFIISNPSNPTLVHELVIAVSVKQEYIPD